MRHAADHDVQFGVGDMALVAPFVAEHDGGLSSLKRSRFCAKFSRTSGNCAPPASCRHRPAPARIRPRHECRKIPTPAARTSPADGSRNRRAGNSGGCLVARTFADKPHETMQIGGIPALRARGPQWRVVRHAYSGSKEVGIVADCPEMLPVFSGRLASSHLTSSVAQRTRKV